MDYAYYEESGTVSPEALDNLPMSGKFNTISTSPSVSNWFEPANPMQDLKSASKLIRKEDQP